MGHLARATAIAQALQDRANPIIVSVAGAVAELPDATGIKCEYISGKNRGWISRNKWDKYFQARLLALAEETGAKVISFDGVTPYPGFILTKNANPNLSTVWIRRGMWRKNRLRFALPLQSAAIDKIIEPGDFASEYDRGPTFQRGDATLTAPVSLFQKSAALSRKDARALLGLADDLPTVLVQLGTGDSDMNSKLTAALLGLRDWKNAQIVLTKEPIGINGESLIPEGLNTKLIRYFPLANALRAFDAAVTATGYNSVHELLPAQVPTVFISNIRGTDNQELRAQWCADKGFALYADQSDLESITTTVRLLQDENVRSAISVKCSELPETTGAKEIADVLLNLASASASSNSRSKSYSRNLIGAILKTAIFIYRTIKPNQDKKSISDESVIFSDNTEAEFLRNLIRGNRRFEQLIPGASERYKKNRKNIAQRYI
jgi:UDP-N-acetylglucosamine:LPS N-acetylglucosamine transferase